LLLPSRPRSVPTFLLLDEVLSVGDLPFQQQCIERIKEFRSSAKTILFVTHSRQHVIGLCDRAILLETGRLTSDGNAEGVIEAYHRSMFSLLTPSGIEFLLGTNVYLWTKNFFQSFSIALAISLAAERNQFDFRRCRSFKILPIWRLLPKCTLAASEPMA